MHNRFGRRYIPHSEFLQYARHLDVFTEHPSQHILEFLERHGILNPVARIRYPQEIARRWYKERYAAADVPDPIEGDTPRFEAATALHREISENLWSHSDIFGERAHPLDEIPPEQTPFVQTSFGPESFVPWEQFRTVIEVRDGKEIGDGGMYERTCYHYWQVFPLATFLRSGVTILYDLNDEDLARDLWRLRIADSARPHVRASINIEARHELSKIMDRAALFDAVAYFEAYRGNALQKHLHSVDRQTRRLLPGPQREYRRRCREIARETLTRFSLKPGDILEFTRFQCELWRSARDRSPPKLADEYARNIDSTIDLYRQVTGATYEAVTERVGQAGGHFKRILKVIFPDWLDEQRDLAERSLKSWMLPSLAALPAPFTVSQQDITDFCDWLEQQGLYQLYWHFRRLMDIGFSDGPIARSATAAEAVSYANSVELMANAIIEGRNRSPRGSTLAPKVRDIVRPGAPQLVQLLTDFKHLTRTDNSTLKQRLAQIDRLKQGQSYAPALRVLLKLLVIRNEGSHLGFASFNRAQIYTLLEALVQSSLLLWKAR